MNRHLRRAVLAFSVRSRTRKAKLVLEFMRENGVEDVIFAGCSPGNNHNEMIVESAEPGVATVLAAVDMLPCPGLDWPFVRADGCHLPFADGQADLLVAQAFVEHVRGRADQQRFVTGQSRVGRSWVITTPNRWFPTESPTVTLLLHWLPRWRAKRQEFTRILSLSEFRALLPPATRLVGSPWPSIFVAFNSAASPSAQRTTVDNV